MLRKLGTAAAAVLLMVGCAGNDVDDDENVDRDAGMDVVRDGGNNNVPRDGGPNEPPRDGGPRDAGPPRDGGPEVPPPVEVVVSGQLTKLGTYLARNNEYQQGGSIISYGINPPATVVSGPNGNYELRLPANGQVALAASAAGYNQTYNLITTAEDPIPAKRLFIAEGAWLAEIAGAHNVNLNQAFTCQTPGLETEQCVYAAIVGQIQDDGTAGNGTVRPVGNVARDDFSIYGPNNTEWYVRGPYFLDYTGTSSAAAQYSVVYQNGQGEYLGGYYIFFAEIPQMGQANAQLGLQVSINYDDGGNTRYFGPQQVFAFRAPNAGVTWASIYETGVAPPPPPVGDVDFDSQIYPLFLPVAQGGFGCQGCHTNQGGATPAGGMNLYGGPDVAYASLDPNNYPQRVNLQDPTASYLLRRPLYEADGNQDHPIFAFASDQAPGYQLILKWIQDGAIRNAPLPPVSFYNEVRPLLYQPAGNGGAGCYTCHVNGVDETNAPGGFYMGGDGNALYEQLVNTAPTDPGPYNEPYRIDKDPQYTGRSLVLTKPLFENDAVHPVKIFFDNTDPRYQMIYRWIQEGYNNDTP
ncbi:MAG: hypothetical protein RMA76_15585 [Deltaproteobacteria bacterium]|jgi:mono/diheme cytochrome c family protein